MYMYTYLYIHMHSVYTQVYTIRYPMLQLA